MILGEKKFIKKFNKTYMKLKEICLNQIWNIFGNTCNNTFFSAIKKIDARQSLASSDL